MAKDLLDTGAAGNYDAASIEVLEGLEPVRKRPGMYIGGTDERALHHLVSEILDNSMDEAVAGHATRIEVALHEDHSITIADNGRGIPVDPHPKFPKRSALEVIMCTLHAGGKFSGKAYQTSGGLHGVGASVVNALSDSMVVQVARSKTLHEQRFSRGLPLGPLKKKGSAANRRGTIVTFHPDEEIFGSHRFKPARLFKSIRSKAYLFSGVEIRWKSAIDDGETPTKATFHFPGGLSDYLKETLEGASTYAERPFAGSVDFEERLKAQGKVEWAMNWTPARDGFIQSYCNTVPTPEGRHPCGRILGRDPQGNEGVWRARRQPQGGPDHPRRPRRGGMRAGELLHPRPRIRRPDQGPARHHRGAAPGRERRARSFRQLAGERHQIRRRHPRLPGPARRGTAAAPTGEGDPAQVGDQEAAPARQAGRLLLEVPRRH